MHLKSNNNHNSELQAINCGWQQLTLIHTEKGPLVIRFLEFHYVLQDVKQTNLAPTLNL